MVFPIFEGLKPVMIEKSVHKIKESKYYRENYEGKEPPRQRFQEAYLRLQHKEALRTKDYKVLSYFIADLEKDNYFEEYYGRFRKDKDTFIGYRGFVRPLLSYIYNYYDRKDVSTKIYRELKYLERKLRDKIRFQHINIEVNSCSNYESYLSEVKKKFSDIKDLSEIDNLLNNYLLKDTDKFYLSCMIKFIISNHRNPEYFDMSVRYVKLMDLDMQQEVFKGVMDFYIDNRNLDEYPDNWFRLIGDILRNPYIGSNTRWDNLGEKYKEAYRRWSNNKYLYEFFEDTVGGDRERLDFWRKYINSIYRIQYFKEFNNALVMEFKNHTFVELAQQGNACYVYEKDKFNIDEISRLNIKYLSKTEAIKTLKDPYKMDSKHIHRGYWQFDFAQRFRSKGYEQDRW